MQEKPVYKWCAVIWSSFFEDSREISLVSVNSRKLSESIVSRMLRRDGIQVRCMRSPLASLSGLRETRASAPGAAREVGFEEGNAEVYSGNDTGRARTPHLLPSPCYGRQVVSSGVQAETRQNSPNINQARDGS